ncbi:MAG: TIGR00645 family protein [Nitrospirota bacterium]
MKKETSFLTDSRKATEKAIEHIIFASRWLQAPLYVGLILAGALYAFKFLQHLWHMTWDLGQMTETEVMLGVLTLVDITMVANLLTMVTIGGYATFVSKLDLDSHPDRPDWLKHIDAGTMKIKLSGSLVGVSGIHLLQTFINIESMGKDGDYRSVMWQVIIHMTFLASSILLAWTEKILHEKHESH